MKELVNQILSHKELAALPSLLEGGGLPVLISGLSAVHRANLAAALCNALDRPLFVVCPDDTAAENFARDLQSMLQRPAQCLGLREFTFLPAEAVSRRVEQQRLAVLSSLIDAEQTGKPTVTVASVSALLQRTVPKEILQKAAFTISSEESYAIEDIEEALIRCGYEKTEQVEGPGQFARRGGILDPWVISTSLPSAGMSMSESAGFFQQRKHCRPWPPAGLRSCAGRWKNLQTVTRSAAAAPHPGRLPQR